MCVVRDLVRTYPATRGRRGAPGSAAVRATDGVSLEIRRGEIFGLLGPNGAGKSTLVRQLTGLMRPDSGSVGILGHDIVRYPERASRILAYLGQESSALDELTVSLAAETTGRLRGLDLRTARAERDAVVEELGLGAIASRPLKKLSGGQRRLACFAAALVGERPLLVLDEPTTGMDPVARRAVWAAVDRRRAESGATVVLVTHNVIEAETVLDRVAVLDRGRVIACDTPAGLKEKVMRRGARRARVAGAGAPGRARRGRAARLRRRVGAPLVAAAGPGRGTGRRRRRHRRPRVRRAGRFLPDHAEPGRCVPGARRRGQGAGEVVNTAAPVPDGTVTTGVAHRECRTR